MPLRNFILFAFIALLGCAEEPFEPIPANNPDLLFPQAVPMDITQVMVEGQVAFDLGSVAGSFSKIAIFEEIPALVDGVVISPNAPVWEYLGQGSSDSRINLEAGTLRADVDGLDSKFFLCSETNFYWAAWAWEETAHFVTYSSLAVNVLETPTKRPDLRLLSARTVGAGPNDTFLRAGAEVQLQLIVENTGELIAEEIRFTLRQNDITELPLEGIFENIPPGGTANKTVTFTMPVDGNYGDEYRFDLLFTTNDCVDSAQEFSLRINDVRVSLVDVRLKRILYLPPDIFWDFGLPISLPPDIYYLIFSPTGREVRRSTVIVNATDDFPSTPCLADWGDLAPVLDLSIDSTYSIQFWDEDPFDADDEIATITFRPLDYVNSRPELLIDTTTEVITELVLRWE